MARTGWGTTNYLSVGSAPVTATPLTLAAWAKTDTIGVTQSILSLTTGAGTADRNAFLLRVRSTDEVNARVCDGSTGTNALTSADITVNTWFHAAAVFTSPTSYAAFLNGGSKGTATTSRTPSGVAFSSIGATVFGTVEASAFASAGLIAEAGIWNIALSDVDIAALATGVSPLRIHPEALLAYWPLIGNNSPENNLLSNAAALSITGSLSAAAHPRIIMPRKKGFIYG